MPKSPARNERYYGPTPAQLAANPPRYFASQGALKDSGLSPKSGLFGSPLVFGANDYRYQHYIQYFHDREIAATLKPDDGAIGSSYGWYYPWRKDLTTFPWTSNQSNIRAQSFLGDATGFVKSVNTPTPPSSQQASAQIIDDFVARINSSKPGLGLFASLTSQLPDNFAIALVKDFDILTTNGDGAQAGSFAEYDYWRHYHQSPLGGIYERFYDPGDPTGLVGNNFKYENSKAEPNASASHPIVVDWRQSNDPVALVTGPFSGTKLKLGNGNNVVALSPISTLAFHRKRALNGDAAYSPESWYDSQTVFYPSSVGRFGSNSITLGDGDNVVYYDSSVRTIDSGKGDNVYIPSFASFGWGIDWINRAYNDGLNGDSGSGVYDYYDSSNDGRALITPVPWADAGYDPKTGEPRRIDYISDPIKLSKATLHDRASFAKSANLYTINSEWVDSRSSGARPMLKHYFNGSSLSDANKKSFNPVNDIGGITIKANGGNNTFYGFDPKLWEDRFRDNGLTTANQPADGIAFKRAATNAWHGVTMLGGSGSNYFWLGNVIDDITNNGSHYKGDYSYRLSLTHDQIYTLSELNRPINKDFGNVYGRRGDEATLSSIVNLSLQADPSTLSVITQKADPERALPSTLDQVGPYNSLANAINKGFGNSEKAFTAYSSYLKSKGTSDLKRLLRFASTAVPYVDFAVSAVSAAVGLVGLFSKSKAQAPKQEIKATYFEQGLDAGFKAVRINDFNPYLKVNLNLPATNSSAWDSLSLQLKAPEAVATNNTQLGSYLNLRKTVLSQGKEDQKDFPLVVFENLDRQDANFGYYSYNFLDRPSGASSAAIDQFTRIGKNQLALMATLPNPQNVIDASGNPSGIVTIPGHYAYFSEEGFDMRNDSMNFPSFNDGDPNNYYSRYYFAADSINPDPLFPSGWSAKEYLRPHSTVVSLEFDSRQLGWYWQAVMTSGSGVDPSNATIDFDRSKLWISQGRGNEWKAFSFLDLNSKTEAFKNSLMARTFYHLKGADPKQEKQLEDTLKLYRQLGELQVVMPDLNGLDQRPIRNPDLKLAVLEQITSVEKVVLSDMPTAESAFQIGYQYVGTDDQAQGASLVIVKTTDGAVQALPNDPAQRDLALKVRRLAGLIGEYREKLDKETYWKKVIPNAPFLESLDQVRAVMFNSGGTEQYPVHTIDYVSSAAGGLHRLQIFSDTERPGYWLATYEGQLAQSLSSALQSVDASSVADSSSAVIASSDVNVAAAESDSVLKSREGISGQALPRIKGQITSGSGVDRLIGGKGRNLFVFRGQGTGFDVAEQAVDKIVNFQNGRDLIGLHCSSFRLNQQLGTPAVPGWFESVADVSAAASSSARIVYAKREHLLIYNANSEQDGFGSEGGPFAHFDAGTLIDERAFVLL
jgi:hypothetical protein